MDFMSAAFWSALLSIIIIDLVLAGDNAIVIGLVARNLPQHQQKKVILWGTFGAVLIRSVLTLAVVWLLRIPGLLLIGGLLLIWIAVRLLVQEKKHDMNVQQNFWAAVRTIVMADAIMGLDNVLAVAGAAHGSFILALLGLLISVPIVIWGSTLFVKVVERYSVVVYIGAGVLAWTAAKMIVDEPFLNHFFESNPFVKWVLTIGLIAAVIMYGRNKKMNKKKLVST